MKHLLFFCLLLITSGSVYAQGQQTCGIFYSYDANGERILRKDDCVGNESNNPLDKPLHGVLYPNPTVGPFTVSLNELVSSATLHVYRIDGVLVNTILIEEGYEMHGDLTDQLAGSYVLDLNVIRTDGTIATQSFTLIKNDSEY